MFIIGERINPAGKPDLIRAMREGKETLVQQEAIAQERAGAQALDINVFLPDIERTQAMRIAVEGVRRVSQLPLMIDDRDPEVIEVGLRTAGREAWINSPVDVQQVNQKIFSLGQEFSCEMFVLPMKGGQIPKSPQENVEFGRLVLERLQDFGIARDRVAFDAILYTLRQAKEKVIETLETIKRLKSELGVKTVIGLSNISYGLKNRAELNARFLKLAKACGLDAVICDPLQKEVTAVAKGDTESAKSFETKQFLEFAESVLGET